MTTVLKTRRCLVCGAVDSNTRVLDGLARCCDVCSFTWTERPPADAADLYQSEYFTGEGYADYYQPKARRSEAALRLRWLLSACRPGSLLEAGSAGGFFVEAALSAGIAARGIEVGAAAVRYATSVLGVPVVQGFFETAPCPTRFDAVCAFHVLEHVDDPARFLDVARDRLTPGGRIAIEVPNIGSAAARRLGASWPSIEPRYHRWHFTPQSLTRLVNAHGFEIEVQDTVFSRFYWRRPARYLHARELYVADWAASRRPAVSHPTMGDVLRMVARRTEDRPVPTGGAA